MSTIAPYESSHLSPTGPGDERPTATQIVLDQGLLGQLTNFNIAITGGSAGLGRETAKALHATGARIFILVPPVEGSAAAAKEIEEENKADSRLTECQSVLKPIETIFLDLGSQASVRDGAKELRKKTANRLNVLICNAGIMSPPFTATKDGFEPHFGINFLGHFLLVNELTDALESGAKVTPQVPSRIVCLSSLGHRACSLSVADLPPKVPDTVSQQAAPELYNDSKLLMLWMANEAERRFSNRNVHCFSVNPGSIETPLTAHLGWNSIRAVMGDKVKEFDRLSKSIPQGAATTVWGAVGKELEGQGGLYLDDVRVALPAGEGRGFCTHGYAPHAYDRKSEHELWKLADSLIKE